MFGPNKATPALTANRLSLWALFLRQLNYTIEYRKTPEHSNADVLSRLPVGEDPNFDKDENTDDVDTVCIIPNTEFAGETNRLGYVAERFFSRSNFDEGHAFHERRLAREKRRR